MAKLFFSQAMLVENFSVVNNITATQHCLWPITRVTVLKKTTAEKASASQPHLLLLSDTLETSANSKMVKLWQHDEKVSLKLKKIHTVSEKTMEIQLKFPIAQASK